MSTPSRTPSSRRVPPPCWTHDETFALINAYKDKWFALRRGNLRASDWDDVSSAVATGSSSKSSIQCRHKIEKLRKRYRAEKQRWANHPGKFSSSWDLFPMLDAMGFASTPVVGSQDPDHDDGGDDKADGIRLKLKKAGRFDGDSDSNVDFDYGYGNGYGVEIASRSREKNYVKVEADFRASNDFDYGLGSGYSSKRKINGDFQVNNDLNRNLGGWFDAEMQGEKGQIPQGMRYRSYDKNGGDRSNSVLQCDRNVIGGFPVKTLGDRSMHPQGFKPKYSSKADGAFNPNLDYDDEDDRDDRDRDVGFAKFSGEWDLPPQGFRGKRFNDEKMNSNADFRASNGFASSSRSGCRRNGGGKRVKRDSGAMEEVASSIRMLTDVFVKMEKMKMDMAREIEKMRMEMELKHSQMVLESQQQIMDAFAEAFIDRKNKKANAKAKAKASMASPHMNGDEDDDDDDEMK